MIQASVSEKKIPIINFRKEDNQPEIIGNYQIDYQSIINKKLGKTVYQGWKINSKMPITVKVIQHQGNMNKFLTLAKQHLVELKTMNYENILNYLDVFVANSKLYMISDKVDCSLDTYIRKNTNLQQTQIIKLFMELCSSLVYLKKNSSLNYTFSIRDIYIKNHSIKLDCVTFYEKHIRQASMRQVQPQKTQLQALALVLVKLCNNSMINKQKKFQSSFIQTIFQCLNDPQKYRISSVQQLVIKLQSQIKISKSKGDGKNKLFMKIDKVLLNQLNYIVFHQNLLGILDVQQNINKQQKLILIYLIKFNLKTKINKLHQISTQNIYKMQEWQNYIKHKNFQTYIQVIDQLYSKITQPELPQVQDKRIQTISTNEYIQSEGFLMNFQFYLRKYISKLKIGLRLNSGHNTQVQKNTIILLDYLLSAYQINSLNIEHYRDPYMFAMQSYLDSIVKGTVQFDPKMINFLIKKLETLEF